MISIGQAPRPYSQFRQRKTTPDTKAKAVKGITKLAKLDFLLRYPTCLERALHFVNTLRTPIRRKSQPRERTSIESKMIRFRYGRGDPRYRRWLGFALPHAGSYICGSKRKDRPDRSHGGKGGPWLMSFL